MHQATKFQQIEQYTAELLTIQTFSWSVFFRGGGSRLIFSEVKRDLHQILRGHRLIIETPISFY